MNNKISAKQWISFLVAGFVGQIAWALENMYLNVFAFRSSGSYDFIPIMTAASAAAATITTLLMGALSDRLGKRKAFITFGYIIWGISIILFALFDTHSPMSIVGNSGMLAGTMIVIMDCVMTFFGSTANDAAFNAYVTDNTNENNRGKVESALSILPMVAMILMTVLGGVLVPNKDSSWMIFFIIFGGLTTVAGIALLFLLPKDTLVPNKEEPYVKNIFYGFRPSVIKANPMLYITLVAFGVFNIAIQVFFPYFIVYIQNVLGLVEMDFIITIGAVLVVACIITVVFGLFMDKIGKNKIIIPSICVAAVGALLFFFANNMVFAIIAGIILMSGYLVSTAVFGAKIRDFTPKEGVGLFQGIRLIFMVLIPMVTGPYIGKALMHINMQTYTDPEFNITSIQPNQYIFLGAIVFFLLSLIPIIILLRKEKKNQQPVNNENNEQQ